LFIERGFAGTSVNEVVRRAGGSLATLYAQYGNKEVLFEAVMNRRSAMLFDGIFPDSDDRKARQADIADELLQLARRLQAHMFSSSSLGVFRLAVHEGPNFPSVRNAVLNNGLRVFLKRLADYLAGLKERLDIDDPDRAAEEFLTLIQGQQRTVAACGDLDRITRKQREDHVKRAVEIFLLIYPAIPSSPARRGKR
jgi:AcrR family transcriptional regulator